MKIIHTADVHLGASPDMGYPWEAERSASLWTVFKRLIKRAGEEKADMLLISGDLFHGMPSEYDLKEVNYLFSSIPETAVVICAGNHDHIDIGNHYRRFKWSGNVIGLWERELTSVSVPGKDARVYGLSYYGNEAADDLYAGAHKTGREKYHILLFHGGDARHSPVSREKLAAMDFDYIAMGHIHKPGYVIKNKAAYSGALTPIDRDDTGAHGYISVRLDDGIAGVEFVRFCPFEYKDAVVYCDESDTVLSIEDKIRTAVEENGIENGYRIMIKGSGSAAKNIQLKNLWEFGHVLEVNDMTAQSLDMDMLEKKYAGTLLGEYIKELRGRNDEIGRYALNEGVRVILEAMEQDGRAR